MSRQEASEGSKSSSQHALAELYRRSLLDPVVEIAHAVAHDAVRRPRHYRDVPDSTGRLLESFRSRNGNDPDWPSAAQRSALFAPFLTGAFCGGSLGVWQAARALTKPGSDENNETLVQGLRDEVATFRTCLKTLEGSGLSAVDRQTGAIFSKTLSILQDEMIARVYGLAAAPARDWDPGVIDGGDAAALIQEICRSLNLWKAGLRMTQRRFLLLRRAAYYGALTISAILHSGKDDANGLRGLARTACSWEQAMRGLFQKVDTARAWKDLQYRGTLCQAERSLLPPHPSGDIDLSRSELETAAVRVGNGGWGFSTQTVGDSICCCTGDLPCGQTSEGGYCNPTNVGFTCPVTDCGTDCGILT